MSHKFHGAEIHRLFTWNYTCVHCGKPVEYQSGIIRRYEGDMAEARAKFAGDCEAFTAQWESGVYPPDVVEGRSICPHCKKHQHWSRMINELPAPGNSRANVRNMILLVILALIFSSFPALIAAVITKLPVVYLCVHLPLFAVSAVFLYRSAQTNKADVLKQKADLETMERKPPVFVSWGISSERMRK